MRHLTITFCIIYLLVNLFLYRIIWQQVWTPENPSRLYVQGETPFYEFVAETVRLNIRSFKNPFESTDALLYPNGWNFAMEDSAPINGLWFLLVRPFLSIHQSFMLLLVLGVFVSNISMYIYLRILKIRKSIAFLMGLLYGFTPFVSQRIAGHPTYVLLYTFVLPAIFFTLLVQTKNARKKLLYSLILGVANIILLLSNLYFTIMFVIMVILLCIFSLLFLRKQFIKLVPNIRYIIFSTIVSLILLIPWIIKVIESVHFNPPTKPLSLIDSITYSSDIFGFFWPRGNIFYKPVLDSIINLGYKPFFETLIYPGIILIIMTIVYLFKWKKLPIYLLPLYLTALSFLVLTFGPYIKIVNFQSSIPLPYMILNYIPFFQMARAPGRFIVIFIFLMCIVGAFILEKYSKLHKQNYKKLIITLFIIFCIDQWIYIPPPLVFKVPNKIYNFISKKPSTPLLEIPFTIRDGLKNHGYLNSIWSVYPQLSHKHPIFGIYGGRIADNEFNYYKNHSFFGPLGELISLDKSNKSEIAMKLTVGDLKNTADFFNIQYILVQDNEPYTPYVNRLLLSEYSKLMKDQGYTLWERKKSNRSVTTKLLLNEKDNKNILQSGWSIPEPQGRWTTGKESILYLNAQKESRKFILTASTFVENQEATIYINRKKIKTVSITSVPQELTLDIPKNILKDVNTIIIQPSKIVIPSSVAPANKDARSLGIFIKSVELSSK